MSRPHPELLSLAKGLLDPTRLDEEVLSSAIEHRLAGLVQTAAMEGRVTGSPELLARLEAYDLETWVRHQVIISELGRVKALLDTAGIRFMVLKGVAAEARWYGRVGERPCWDLDILIDPDDPDHADEAVRLLQPDHVLLGRIGNLIRSGHLQSFTVISGPIVIDLHTDLFKLGVPTRSNRLLWQTSVTTPVEGVGRVTVASAAFSLIHFLTHLNRDRFNRLLGYVDVGRVLDDPDLDFDLVDRILESEGLEVVASSALSAVGNVLGRQQIPLSAAGGWRRLAWDYLWPDAIRLRGQEGRLRFTRRGLMLPFLLRGRFGEAVRSLWRRLAPPAVLIEYVHGDQAGGAWIKALRGRGAFVLRRRAARRRLRDHMNRPQGDGSKAVDEKPLM